VSPFLNLSGIRPQVLGVADIPCMKVIVVFVAPSSYSSYSLTEPASWVDSGIVVGS